MEYIDGHTVNTGRFLTVAFRCLRCIKARDVHTHHLRSKTLFFTMRVYLFDLYNRCGSTETAKKQQGETYTIKKLCVKEKRNLPLSITSYGNRLIDLFETR